MMRRFLERQQTIAGTARIEGRQRVIVSCVPHADLIPRISAPRLQLESIERRGDLLIGKLTRHLPDHINDFDAGAASMPASLVLLDAEL